MVNQSFDDRLAIAQDIFKLAKEIMLAHAEIDSDDPTCRYVAGKGWLVYYQPERINPPQDEALEFKNEDEGFSASGESIRLLALVNDVSYRANFSLGFLVRLKKHIQETFAIQDTEVAHAAPSLDKVDISRDTLQS